MSSDDFKEVTSDFFAPLENEALAKDLAELVNKMRKYPGRMTREEATKYVKPLFIKNGETWDE